MPGYHEIEAFLNAEAARRPRRREHRLPRDCYAQTDVAFLLTLCARHHGQPFRLDQLARAVVDGLEFRRQKGLWQVYVYCVMPGHLHAVLQLEPQDADRNRKDLLDLVAEYKSFTTRRAWSVGLSGRLWQRDQYDRLLRSDREFETRCRYVLENPVRKGLVEDWTLWPYSGMPDDW
jgi:REP element-mobilizing transposase RayT